ncbi:MAG: secretory subunit [Sclerophora amabilis]|nr:MAG: secretory subunit [Sclerophora amabilis]
MSTDYNYDDQAQFFPYFILTMSGLVTLPLTYSLLKPSKDIENTAPRIQTTFKSQDADLVEKQKKKQRRRERKLKRIITVIAGWGMMGWMIYLIIVTAKTTPKLWDPYDILGISRSLDEKAIKSRYKRLSLKFHPDKIRPDPAKNQTIETLNSHFVELTKAYKALTDEEVRNNYVQYGHPDGKQSFSIGIALPKFIVTEGNGKYVLLVYGLLLGVLLPYVVGKWWYGTQRMTREKVLITSAGNLFREYEDSLNENGAIGALSSGEEFNEVFRGNKAEAGSAKVEGRILSDEAGGSLASGMALKDRTKLERLDGGARRKALGLLWAYIGRVDLGNHSLNEEKYEVAPIALALNESLLAISLAFGNVGPILSVFHTSQNLIQALSPSASPLMQLPHITPTVASAIEGHSTKSHLSIQKFMRMPDDKRRKLSLGPGLLSNPQYETAIAVARQMPVLHVEKAFFKVTGERFVTPGSLVQFVVKARAIPPGTVTVPEVNELDLEDVDPDEGDTDALLGRKGAKDRSAKPEEPKSPVSSTDEKPIQPPLAFAPFFARDHSPRWHVFLADSKQGKMAVPPFTFTTFNKPLYTDNGEPTFAVQTFKMQFQAPPHAGQYTFVMHLICDSYVGTDTKMEVTLCVEEMARAEEIGDEDEISEPDEDSLAGQMNALKTGGVVGAEPSGKRKKKPVVDDSSDDDESNTEGEEGDDTSDTDTDTDTDDE